MIQKKLQDAIKNCDFNYELDGGLRCVFDTPVATGTQDKGYTPHIPKKKKKKRIELKFKSL